MIVAALAISMLAGAPAHAADEIAPPADLAILGDLRVGETVTVPTEGWTPEDVDLDATWFVGDEEIIDPEEAIDPFDLTLLPGWAGQEVSVEITASIDGGAPVVVPLSGHAPIALGTWTSATPTISGNGRVGELLNASVAGLPDDADPTYQWLLDGAHIEGAVDSSYVPLEEELGRSLSVRATITRDGYEPVEVTSTTVKVTGVLTVSQNPSISGTVRVGTKLTASPGVVAPTATFTYAWKVAGTTVGTANTFTPTAAQVGKRLTLTVTAKRTGYPTVTFTTKSATIAKGKFTTAPTPKITGTKKVGSTLKATAGTWAPKATLKYQWERNGVSIKGATKSTYKLTSADWKKKITVTVTASRTAYTTVTKTSAKTTAVTKSFTKTAAPKITGTKRVNSTLKATVAAWSPKATLSYQWKRNGVAIKGATKSTYKLKAADHGKRITVTVTGKKSGYATTSRTSAATTKIALPAAVITKAGTYKVGTDIKPGTYVANNAKAWCYWERRSTAGSSLSGIIANDLQLANGRAVVTISSKDKFFKTDAECGSWVPFVKVGTPKTSVGNGTHVVGTHVAPGLYKSNSASKGCYWEIVSGFGGTLGEIIENDFTYTAPNYVYIYSDDKGFHSNDCGTWTRVGI